jgi:hypothetical protein
VKRFFTFIALLSMLLYIVVAEAKPGGGGGGGGRSMPSSKVTSAPAPKAAVASSLPANKISAPAPSNAARTISKPLPASVVMNASPNLIKEKRDSYFSRYNYRPESYSRPSYGFFNSPWLWFYIGTQLGGSSSEAAQVMHHHSNDPEMQQFWSDAQEKAKTDPELAKRLADIEAEKLKIADQPKNPDYMPENVPSEVAVADDYNTYNGSTGCFISVLLDE